MAEHSTPPIWVTFLLKMTMTAYITALMAPRKRPQGLTPSPRPWPTTRKAPTVTAAKPRTFCAVRRVLKSMGESAITMTGPQ